MKKKYGYRCNKCKTEYGSPQATHVKRGEKHLNHLHQWCNGFAERFELVVIQPGTDVEAIRALSGDPFWRSQDGRRCRFSEIEWTHLLNIIRKMERDKWQLKWLPRMKLERAIREYQRKAVNDAVDEALDYVL